MATDLSAAGYKKLTVNTTATGFTGAPGDKAFLVYVAAGSVRAQVGDVQEGVAFDNNAAPVPAGAWVSIPCAGDDAPGPGVRLPTVYLDADAAGRDVWGRFVSSGGLG